MDIIYSRPRIRFPKLFIIKNRRKSNKTPYKYNKSTLILFLIFMVIGIALTAVAPVFNQLCRDKAKGKATIIVNEETKKSIKNYDYQDFIVVHKDENGNVLMLESNMININNVITDVANNIQNRIDSSEDEEIKINLGTFTGINILAGRGIGIPIKISTIGNVQTEIKSQFVSKGINQTLHRLYLDVECEISILTPFNTINEKIKNQVIIAENVIVGNIPDTYYNLDGVTMQDSIELLE